MKRKILKWMLIIILLMLIFGTITVNVPMAKNLNTLDSYEQSNENYIFIIEKILFILFLVFLFIGIPVSLIKKNKIENREKELIEKAESADDSFLDELKCIMKEKKDVNKYLTIKIVLIILLYIIMALPGILSIINTAEPI